MSEKFRTNPPDRPEEDSEPRQINRRGFLRMGAGALVAGMLGLRPENAESAEAIDKYQELQERISDEIDTLDLTSEEREFVKGVFLKEWDDLHPMMKSGYVCSEGLVMTDFQMSVDMSNLRKVKDGIRVMSCIRTSISCKTP